MNNFHVNNPLTILEEGSSIFFGIDEVLIKNIETCLFLRGFISSSFGPEGMNKLIIQESGKSILTNNCFDILKFLDLMHPISRLLIYFSGSQEANLGDSTGFFLIFSSELLKKAIDLLKDGFHISEIVDGFSEGGKLALNFIESLAPFKLSDFSNLKVVASLLSLIIGRNIQGLENYLAPQIAYACIKTYSSKKKNFSINDIRVIKVLGGSFEQIKTINGTVILKDSENTIKRVRKARIAIFLCDFDSSSPETKNSMLFKNAEDLMSHEFKKNKNTEDLIKIIFEQGLNVVIASNFTEMSLFFLEKYEIMAIKIQSKFDLRRIAMTSNAIVLNSLRKPAQEEIGRCDLVSVRSFGSQKITIFQQENSGSKIFTIIARASSSNILDYIERLICRSTSAFRTIIRDNRFVAGGGACEIEIYRRLKSFSLEKYNGPRQFIIQKFTEAFESIPKTLCENSGHDTFKILSSLHIAHSKGEEFEGIDLQNTRTLNSKKNGIWDSLPCKYWAIRNSLDVSILILTVDQILMARKFNREISE